MRGLEWASGKNPLSFTGAVFVISAQAVDLLQENSCTYGVSVSELTIYSYVDGNPLSKTDPEGLSAITVAGGAALTAYTTYKLFATQMACEKLCDITQGDAVKSCGDPDRQDILDIGKNQRVLACKASCAMGSVFSRLLPGKLK